MNLSWPKVSPDLSFGIQILKRLHGANIVSLNVASVVVVFFLHFGLKMMLDVANTRRYVVFTVYMRTTSK